MIASLREDLKIPAWPVVPAWPVTAPPTPLETPPSPRRGYRPSRRWCRVTAAGRTIRPEGLAAAPVARQTGESCQCPLTDQ
jgi:hypothetical protein